MITLETHFAKGDISDAIGDEARRVGTVAWDIETSGLNWASDDIRTCQLLVGDRVVIVQLLPDASPSNLIELLADSRVRKIFHHAPFDVRFMTFKWSVRAANIACTKIAAKILHPGLESNEYSLKSTLKRYLDIDIDKSQRMSDWSRSDLSKDQVAYAANDVLYLLDLYDLQSAEANTRNIRNLVEESFEYIPTRARLDILGASDVFTY